MNNFLKSIMAIALAAFVFTGCVDDPCDSIECGVNGNPIESADGSSCSCECINGFEGTTCDVLATGKFIGNWDALDMCSSENFAYDATINPLATDQTKVQVTNFGGFGELLSWSTVISGDTISIPLSDVQGLLAEGMGIMSTDGNTINWEYTVTDATGGEDSCSGVWTKVQ